MKWLGVVALPLLVVACDSSDDCSGDGSGGHPSDGGSTDTGADVVADTSPLLEAGDAPIVDVLVKPDVEDAGACTLTKPYSSQNAACNACAEQHCCSQVNACTADAECDDSYVNCILACALLPEDGGADAGIDPCLADCESQYPKGKAEFDAAIGCADTQCSVECQ